MRVCQLDFLFCQNNLFCRSNILYPFQAYGLELKFIYHNFLSKKSLSWAWLTNRLSILPAPEIDVFVCPVIIFGKISKVHIYQ